MSGKRSRDKGKRGERELANYLNSTLGITGCRRGQQYSGVEGEDVVGLPGIHNEVKRVESFSLYKAMEQAEKDSGDKIPLVHHRKNGEEWVTIVKTKDLARLTNQLQFIVFNGEAAAIATAPAKPLSLQ